MTHDGVPEPPTESLALSTVSYRESRDVSESLSHGIAAVVCRICRHSHTALALAPLAHRGTVSGTMTASPALTAREQYEFTPEQISRWM